MSASTDGYPLRTVLGTIGLVAVCTTLLPNVSGYGTVWSQMLREGAWSAVAKVSSAGYANLHRDWVEGVTMGLSLAAFAIPTGFLWTVLGSERPRLFRIVLIAWTAFYLAALFFLFPGPVAS